MINYWSNTIKINTLLTKIYPYETHISHIIQIQEKTVMFFRNNKTWLSLKPNIQEVNNWPNTNTTKLTKT